MSEPEPLYQVHLQMPGKVITATFASADEYADSRRLAQSRQEVAAEGASVIPWGQLTDHDRAMAAVKARPWLLAARRAGLAGEWDIGELEPGE